MISTALLLIGSIQTKNENSSTRISSIFLSIIFCDRVDPRCPTCPIGISQVIVSKLVNLES